MKKSWLLFVLILGFISTPLSIFAATVEWQAGAGVNVNLSIRAKNGMPGSYDAIFIVTAPNGKEYRAQRKVGGDNDAAVVFPPDFHAPGDPGKYLWKCLVGNKIIVNGAFDYSTIMAKVGTVSFK